MKFNNVNIVKSRNGELWTTITGDWLQVLNLDAAIATIEFYNSWKKNRNSAEMQGALNDLKAQFDSRPSWTNKIDALGNIVQVVTEADPDRLTNGLSNMINFFSEFDFEPNFRFVNTIVNLLATSGPSLAKSYVNHYFNLTNNDNRLAISDKLQSIEFSSILKDISVVRPNKRVNDRFKVYYGAPGTGKTTQALIEAKNVCMVCHSAMLPSDLMEDFLFEEGKATFSPSGMQMAMINGTSIVLDEINMLPFESLRFLQSILDGKKQILYKGKTIDISDGFKIIGTMNLMINNCIYALPEPLVDRAESIVEYSLTAKNLLGAII